MNFHLQEVEDSPGFLACAVLRNPLRGLLYTPIRSRVMSSHDPRPDLWVESDDSIHRPQPSS